VTLGLLILEMSITRAPVFAKEFWSAIVVIVLWWVGVIPGYYVARLQSMAMGARGRSRLRWSEIAKNPREVAASCR